MINKKLRNDIFLGAALLLLALIGFVVFKLNLKDGACVNVLVNGKVRESYSLSQEIKTVIITEKGNNTLVIKNGKAYIEEADCPDKICANHRKISKTGETIVCLPHKLVVEITEDEKNK